MTDKKFQLRIITPSETKVDKPVEMVIMRCIDGDWGVMAGHDKRSGVLMDFGVVRVFDEGNERRLAAYGGIAEFQDDMLTILTSEAFWPEDIDLARAETDLEIAKQRLHDKSGKVDEAEVQMYGVRLRRSLVMIEVSSYPMVGK